MTDSNPVSSQLSPHLTIPTQSQVDESLRQLNSSLRLYSILGCSSCPFLARADRLSSLLRFHWEFNENQIETRLVAPEDWETEVNKLSQLYGFQSQLQQLYDSIDSDSVYRTARVLVWHPLTGRLLGGEREYRAELKSKYGIECDLEWPALAAIAEENHEIFIAKRSRDAEAEVKRVAGEKIANLAEKERRHTLKFNRM